MSGGPSGTAVRPALRVDTSLLSSTGPGQRHSDQVFSASTAAAAEAAGASQTTLPQGGMHDEELDPSPALLSMPGTACFRAYSVGFLAARRCDPWPSHMPSLLPAPQPHPHTGTWVYIENKGWCYRALSMPSSAPSRRGGSAPQASYRLRHNQGWGASITAGPGKAGQGKGAPHGSAPSGRGKRATLNVTGGLRPRHTATGPGSRRVDEDIPRPKGRLPEALRKLQQ